MTKESEQYYRYIYSMGETDKGIFVQIQFDQQFKGDVDEVRQLLSTITKHTISGSSTTIRFSRELINLEGYFADNELGQQVYKQFISRILNKPKCYENAKRVV